MNVVLYMRYSSDKQTEQSIEGQRRVCMDFCEKNGYEVVEQYIDRATSAFKDTDKRTQFQKMIRDSEKQQWQGVVVYKLDRFARNRYDSATYKAKLKKNGVRVISATENISENPEGVILEAVLEGMAEFYSKELSQKITRGMYESASKGKSIGGYSPLGYKNVNKKLVVDEAGAVIVKEAFRLYAQGKSMADICALFNSKGYRTAKGAEFNKNSFHSMFRNKKYIGVYEYKDIVLEDAIPAIIDKDVFNVVQRRLNENEKAPSKGKAQVDYMLAQKIFCGHCGANMVGECGTSHTGVKHHYYVCANRKRKLKGEKCNKKSVNKDAIEELVVRETLKLLTPEVIDKIAEIAIQENDKAIRSDKVIPLLEADLKELNKSINNLVRMIEKGAESDTLALRLTELEKEKRAVEIRLDDAKSDVIVLEKPHVIWWLTKFTQGEIEDYKFRRHIIDLLVNSVTVYDNPDGGYDLTILYNLSSENRETYKVGSDSHSEPPPLESNPNLFVANLVFGLIVKNRQR